jgi:hypothetical protein
MLVTFTTDAYADITMFGDVALAMLKMMGHSATVPGAILAEDVPVAPLVGRRKTEGRSCLFPASIRSPMRATPPCPVHREDVSVLQAPGDFQHRRAGSDSACFFLLGGDPFPALCHVTAGH